MFDPKKIASSLSAHRPALKFKASEEWDEATDGEVEVVGTGVTVQVGCSYLIVGRWDEGAQAMTSWPDRRNVGAMLLADLDAALKEDGKSKPQAGEIRA